MKHVSVFCPLVLRGFSSSKRSFSPLLDWLEVCLRAFVAAAFRCQDVSSSSPLMISYQPHYEIAISKSHENLECFLNTKNNKETGT